MLLVRFIAHQIILNVNDFHLYTIMNNKFTFVTRKHLGWRHTRETVNKHKSGSNDNTLVTGCTKIQLIKTGVLPGAQILLERKQALALQNEEQMEQNSMAAPVTLHKNH